MEQPKQNDTSPNLESDQTALTHHSIRTTPRIPPGQRLAKKWPVLSIESPPPFDGKNWDLEITGLVKTPQIITWDELLKLPKTKIKNDIHCVTSWSLLDQTFSGVSFKKIIELAEPLPQAKYATFEAYSGYSSALPLTGGYLDHPDVILAYEYEDQPLPRKHGGPLRLLVPHLYFWKSVKWLTKITFTETWERGYWEQRGYHIRGDPWKEERYSYQE